MSKLDKLCRYGKHMVANGPDGATYFSEDEVRELGKDYVLVPREPTEEMLAAGMNANINFSSLDNLSTSAKNRMSKAAIYKAMIASSEETI